MLDIRTASAVLPFLARQAVRMPYKGATEDDMVRVCEITHDSTDRYATRTLSACFAERTSHAAMAQALASYGAAWDHVVPANRVACVLVAYSDMHGTWCTECGNSVCTGENGGHVCSNPGCVNYDDANCPTWVKELHNVA